MAEKETKEKPLDKMTVKELREIAKDIPEITGVHGMNKSELLDAVKKAKGIVEAPETRELNQVQSKGDGHGPIRIDGIGNLGEVADVMNEQQIVIPSRVGQAHPAGQNNRVGIGQDCLSDGKSTAGGVSDDVTGRVGGRQCARVQTMRAGIGGA